MKTSLVITTLNEAKHIDSLLSSILFQSKKADEIIIVDGGSTDQTIKIIKKYIKNNKIKNIKLFSKKGNRSVGRNYGVSKSKYNLIAFTDAGCILDKNWLKNLVGAAHGVDCVAGYYNSDPITALEAAIVPYILVMPDQVDEANFLPSTRSMLIKKQIFKKLGGFDEKLNHNEDYALAKKLKANNFKIKFARNALVTWIPRNNLLDFFIMILRFALGDIEAGILRPRVLSIFLRYFIFLLLILFNFYLFIILFIIYLIYKIFKNYKYTKKIKYAWVYLPILQVISDVAVILGTVLGYAYYAKN